MIDEQPVLGPTLTGARVRVEPIGEARARALLAGRPEPGLPWERGFPLAPLTAMLRRLFEVPGSGLAFGPFFAYVLIRGEDGRAVGDAGFHGPPGPGGEVEIGYALAPVARGLGLATEGVGLLADWALAQPSVRAVTARVLPDNAPSIRLLDRLGFVPDGEAGAHRRFVRRP